MARLRRRQLMGKVGIKHSDTLLANIGSGSIPTTFEVMETEAGFRSTTGTVDIIQDNATTGEVCRVGDTCKYINLFIQIAARAYNNTNNMGWLEWAFVCVKESETTVPITSIGTQTLGSICGHMFLNECIMTGCIPIGTAIPNFLPIQIKIPKTKMRIRQGDEWRLIVYYRSNNSADVQTDNMRIVLSFMYKSYS